MSDNKRALEFLKNEIALSNKEIPAVKKSLEQLQSEDPRPFFTNHNQQRIDIPVPEITKLATIVPACYHSRIKLPFIFLSRGDHFIFSGSNIERFVAESIIDAVGSGASLQIKKWFFKNSFESKYPFFYTYMLHRIRKHFPSLIYLVFSFT
ncbi:MAG: DUF61 family protein [Candidatus Hodarchaeales archaeon]|jgi:uncharacterized protein (UPF0216 family)